jgi:hypothetical protein
MPTARGRFRSQTNTFPTTFACPFRWAVQIDGQTDVGTADVNAFSLNSLFDPNITGAGTQPKFYDTLLGAAGGTAPYDTYIVVRTHVRVSLQNSSTSSMFAYIQVYSDTAGISPTCPMYEYLEVPNLLKVPLPSASQTGGNRVVEFDVDIAKFLGAEDILDNDNCRAQWDSNPGRQVYMDVGFRSTTDAGTTTFSYTVEIVYEAVLAASTTPLPLWRPLLSLPLVLCCPPLPLLIFPVPNSHLMPRALPPGRGTSMPEP